MKLDKILSFVLMIALGVSSLLISCIDRHDLWDSLTTNCSDCTFVTASTYNGNLGGIAGANAKCMADGNYLGSDTYKALIVDGTNRIASVTANLGDGQVDWVLKSNTNYFRSDGTTLIMITNANGIFVFGTLTNSFDTPATAYWTGLNNNWRTDGVSICSSWIDGTVGSNGSTGNGASSNSAAIHSGSVSCDNINRLLCVEQ